MYRFLRNEFAPAVKSDKTAIESFKVHVKKSFFFFVWSTAYLIRSYLDTLAHIYFEKKGLKSICPAPRV